MKSQIEIYEELKDSLSDIVKIDNGQVQKVIVRDLIKKRKHCIEFRNNEGVEHFDYILKYYLIHCHHQTYLVLIVLVKNF